MPGNHFLSWGRSVFVPEAPDHARLCLACWHRDTRLSLSAPRSSGSSESESHWTVHLRIDLACFLSHSLPYLERSFHRAVSHLSLNGHEFEQALGVYNGQENLACCGPQGCRVDTTEWLNRTELRTGKLERLVSQTKILGNIWTNAQRPIPEPVKLLAFKILANKRKTQHLIGLFGYWS